jgi:hypothetical protein
MESSACYVEDVLALSRWLFLRKIQQLSAPAALHPQGKRAATAA